jgi:hypothetical protein
VVVILYTTIINNNNCTNYVLSIWWVVTYSIKYNKPSQAVKPYGVTKMHADQTPPLFLNSNESDKSKQ